MKIDVYVKFLMWVGRQCGLLVKLCFFLFALQSYGQIRVVCTAALTNVHAEFRKRQYIESFAILTHYGYGYHDVYIVEALCKKGPTFLEKYSSHVFYATANDFTFKNNGINEAATFLESLYHFAFDDEDMIIKFTGRHQLTSDYFLRLVEEHSDYDAFVKVNSDGSMCLLGIAMKCKHFKEMYGRMNFSVLGHKMRSVEFDVGDYIRWKARSDSRFKVFYVEKLHMKANSFGSTTCQGAPDEERYY